MEASPLLDAARVVKRYGDVVALDGVSLTVPVRERLALVGESGSGKTTLLRTFNRMVVPDEGSVRVRGVDVAGTDAVALRRSVGYVQQEGGLLPHWTVLRNVAMVPRLLEREDAAGLAEEALRLVGMEPSTFGTRWPRELSGGQRQRVALARAVAARPDVILMDEPFGAVDAITRSDLQEAFRELVERLGVTVVLVTHDLREAFLLADRVAVMRAGRVEGVAAPDALAETPPTPYVAELLRRAGVA